MENIYKNNLNIIADIQDGETIYYYDNKILKEDRYFGSIRNGNNIDKIINIVNISFLHYYNILLIDNLEKDLESIKKLLKNCIIGLEKFKTYNENNNITSEKIEKLIIQLTNHLLEYENNTFIKNKENVKFIQDNIDYYEDDVFIREEIPNTNCNIIYKIVYGIRNGITGFFMSIYNHIFVY